MFLSHINVSLSLSFPSSLSKINTHNLGRGLKKGAEPWLVWLRRLSTSLQTKGSLIQFSIRAHAGVAGRVPIWGGVRGNHTLVFLSLSFFLPSLLSKNK